MGIGISIVFFELKAKYRSEHHICMEHPLAFDEIEIDLYTLPPPYRTNRLK